MTRRLAPPSAALLLLALSTMTWGGEDAPPRKAYTALEAGPLGRVSSVVVGDVIDVEEVRDKAIARIRVTEVLKGADPGREITVLVAGPKPTMDPSRFDASYLPAKPGLTYVLFLDRRDEGVAFRLDSCFEVEGLEGMEKVRAVKRQAALLAIPDESTRAREVLRYLLEGLKDEGLWTRVNAARELNHFAGVRPDVFDAEAIRRVNLTLRGPSTPAQRVWLRRLLETLGRAKPLGPTEPSTRDAPTGGPDPARADLPAAEQIVALKDRLEQGVPGASMVAAGAFSKYAEETRRWLVGYFAEGGFVEVLPALKDAYSREEDPAVREGILYASGLLGAAADVPWLVARLENRRHVRSALFALARIRSPEALEALANMRETGAKDPASVDRDIPRLLDYLQSPAFEEAERIAGRRAVPAAPAAPTSPGAGGR